MIFRKRQLKLAATGCMYMYKPVAHLRLASAVRTSVVDGDGVVDEIVFFE